VAVREFWEGLQRSATDLFAWWQERSATWVWWPDLLPWFLALLVLLLLLALRRRRPAQLLVAPPALLVTQGEVALAGFEGDRSRRGASPAGVLAGDLGMTLSNLSRYPVQVLEVAVRPSRRAAPRVASVDTLVPALGSAEVRCEIPLQLTGDSLLEVYFYAAAPKRKLYRHRVELVWEPWMRRFKVAPMDQFTTPVRRLPSVEPRALLDIPEPPVGLPRAATEPRGRVTPPPPPAAPRAAGSARRGGSAASAGPDADSERRPPLPGLIEALPTERAQRAPSADPLPEVAPSAKVGVSSPPVTAQAAPFPAVEPLPAPALDKTPRSREGAPPPPPAPAEATDPTPSAGAGAGRAVGEADATTEEAPRPRRNLSFPDKF
jgi:MYXO-CTERM domain-containing protein